MDQIGASHITLPDMIVVGVFLVLYLTLTTLAPNDLVCRLVAILCSFVVMAIVIVLIVFADDLRPNGVHELAGIAMFLCFGLWKWNASRRKENVVLSGEADDVNTP